MLSGIHAAQAPRRRAQGLVVDCDVGLRAVRRTNPKERHSPIAATTGAGTTKIRR